MNVSTSEDDASSCTEKENSNQEKNENNTTKSNSSHHELVKSSKEAINNLIENDPLLRGLPFNVTIEEIKAQIAVAQGQAITLFLNRVDLPTISIVVPTHSTTVLDLKKAIKRHMNLCFKRENVNKKISWKYIWKKYNLCFDQVELSNDKENLKTYGIVNKTELYFAKKHREKNKLTNSFRNART